MSQDLPLVSIVTPVLNMGNFVEETIRSVLSQDYPNLEYIVMDGGSTDGTLEILEKYRGRLSYCSGPDRGTADAINRGFERSAGSFFGFLNADDSYLPGAISAAVRHLVAEPALGAVYGDGNWVDETGRVIRPYPVQPFDPDLFRKECFICQPASLMRREAFELAGRMDPGVRGFDYDLWIRIARVYPMRKIDGVLANSRMHLGAKTLGQRKAMLEDALDVIRSHYGYVPFSQIHAYASYLADRRDQFFEPLRPSFTKYLLSLPVGLRYNARHPFRFFREWARVLTLAGFLRRARALSRRDPGL
ncbi:MAG: glycosyltransferase family 2 protein [Bryobacteraceae bacterium]